LSVITAIRVITVWLARMLKLHLIVIIITVTLFTRFIFILSKVWLSLTIIYRFLLLLFLYLFKWLELMNSFGPRYSDRQLLSWYKALNKVWQLFLLNHLIRLHLVWIQRLSINELLVLVALRWLFSFLILASSALLVVRQNFINITNHIVIYYGIDISQIDRRYSRLFAAMVISSWDVWCFVELYLWLTYFSWDWVVCWQKLLLSNLSLFFLFQIFITSCIFLTLKIKCMWKLWSWSFGPTDYFRPIFAAATIAVRRFVIHWCAKYVLKMLLSCHTFRRNHSMINA